MNFFCCIVQPNFFSQKWFGAALKGRAQLDLWVLFLKSDEICILFILRFYSYFFRHKENSTLTTVDRLWFFGGGKISQNIQLKHACLRQRTRGMLVFIRKKKSSQNFLVGNVWFEYKWIHIAFSIQNNGDPVDRTT